MEQSAIVDDSFFYKENDDQKPEAAQHQNKLKLYLKEGDREAIDDIEITETDPIFSTTYEMMIKEAFRADKHFILAKIKTRSTTNYTQSHSHFFNFYGIMKLIFKKRREEVVGRFHHQHPISSKNPLTNNLIIGEVEVFIFKNPYLDLPAETRYPVGQTLSLEGVKGEFIGTDFNYLYSKDMQNTISSNCLESNQAMMNLDEFVDPINSDWQQFLDRDVNDVQFQNDIQEIIQSAFVNSNKFYIHGAIACVYFLSAISTFLSGLSSFFDRDDDGPAIKPDPYQFILPIAVIIFDCDMRRVYKRKEKLAFTAFKFIYWAFYYIIYGVAAGQGTESLVNFANLMFLVWPCAAICYSFMLMKFKYFSLPIAGQENDQMQRFEDMMQERHQQIQQRQQNFDEQNFGGEQLVAIEINGIDGQQQQVEIDISQDNMGSSNFMNPVVNISTQQRLEQQQQESNNQPRNNEFNDLELMIEGKNHSIQNNNLSVQSHRNNDDSKIS